MGAYPAEASELSEKDISNVVRVDSSAKLTVSSSQLKKIMMTIIQKFLRIIMNI
jgi:hypothetical protein